MTGSARAPRPRRRRTVTESLGSIVLGFEVIIVFLATLATAGLGRLSWPLALTLGLGLCALMIVTLGLLRHRWAVWLGWLSQALFMAGGILVVEIFLVAGIFVAIWAYCMVVGGRLDRQAPGAGVDA